MVPVQNVDHMMYSKNVLFKTKTMQLPLNSNHCGTNIKWRKAVLEWKIPLSLHPSGYFSWLNKITYLNF